MAAPGEEGQIIADLAGDEAFEGYLNRPDADAKSLHAGWYFTGDIGSFDADGDLFVTGRVDDMIITGGENVSPVEVENVLSLCDGVLEVAVAGLPDERWGQKVVAFIRRGSGIDAEALDAHCRTSGLANFKRPGNTCSWTKSRNRRSARSSAGSFRPANTGWSGIFLIRAELNS